ncbi:Panacea domain-containing protein [Methylophaga thalassica]|uniref:Panacea domain-containing protein n=1 Tax=Methylophaga aminisulfidivorans TaxID=230105 RepID=UPI0024E1B741|nr:type II toxin-antitoxin system antitoxin SocA domain-containing protein [Methylophaga aminisulfidivorans]
MATALDVAQFFIAHGANSEEGGVSNLKLQKLVYYAQGFHLAIFDEPLFDEELEAWTHGPVSPSVYHKYKSNGSSPIPAAEYEPGEAFSEEQLEFLAEVHEVFGQFSAWKLRNMTHEERPWLENEELASQIPKNTMLEYFKTRLK